MTTKTASRNQIRLDRRQVLTTALEVVDREGLEALSMRRLGAELSVDPMTIYHYAGGKERLLDGVAELLWEEVALPGVSRDPIEALRNLARSLRDLFRRHPEAAPLILRCSRLIHPQLELYRAYLDALDKSELGAREPASVLRSVLSFALGYGYAEISMLGVQCGPLDSRTLSQRELLLYLGQALPSNLPRRLAEAAMVMIADCDSDQCFEDGLDLMLAGLATSTDTGRTA
ncbi:MAG TPA: TetR/AcrR family transcriptional regulator C-terminal domain-containing protein [Anaerolineales bacterium]|jgi:AcrR family transcriptional regulator|nr:TetR/AcrR family transcriptional regulator C-terminal domain-containing protein [Anaerolineales bacterium]